MMAHGLEQLNDDCTVVAVTRTNNRQPANPHKVKNPDGHILCKICGDKASGYHYGVFSCEGCKGFFRRTVRQNMVYKPCENPNGCLIMRISRNRCQYCRMKKCITAGMSHEGVRLGRCPKKDKPSKTKFFKLPQTSHGSVDVDKQIKSEQMVLTIHDAFKAAFRSFEIYCARFSSCQNTTTVTTESAAKAVYSRYLPGIVLFQTAFAREIPHFTQMTLASQRHLIKASILETAVIHGSLNADVSNGEWIDNKLQFVVPQHCDLEIGILGQLFQDMYKAAKKLQKLELNDVEHSLLAAMLLFCSDRPGVENKYTLERMEHELCLSMKCQMLLSHADDSLVFPKTIEVMTDLRSITTKFLDEMLNAQVEVEDT
ncbi:peroxisome proliferator-activated receptor alpha-like [Mizuhopecten yessoensis]|nr:peroxisome proliferator-activated receptor alpha-like [Mizuhopecten yessoensis]XP_021370914.1 peroxisome proliferator-activated receptor alpha-like [Mizuhopecten yessoensis]